MLPCNTHSQYGEKTGIKRLHVLFEATTLSMQPSSLPIPHWQFRFAPTTIINHVLYPELYMRWSSFPMTETGCGPPSTPQESVWYTATWVSNLHNTIFPYLFSNTLSIGSTPEVSTACSWSANVMAADKRSTPSWLEKSTNASLSRWSTSLLSSGCCKESQTPSFSFLSFSVEHQARTN